MAVLGATSLTGCDSIPSFIGNGSKTVFWMATSPVSWTKDTTVNQGMLRIINGSTLSPGGSLTFSQVFTSNKPISGSISQNSVGFTTTNGSLSTNIGSLTTSAPSASTQSSPATLSTPQINVHYHPHITVASTLLQPGVDNHAPNTATPNASFVNAGQGGGHVHGESHTHSVQFGLATHEHPITGQHQHPISFLTEYNIFYVDMIICTKN